MNPKARLAVLGLVATLSSWLVTLQSMHDPMGWWHLSIGRIIAANRAIPDTNPFVFGHPAPPEIHVHGWLGEVWLYEVWSLGGLQAVMTLAAMLVGVTALMIGLPNLLHRNKLSFFVPALIFGTCVGATIDWGPNMFAVPLAAATSLVAVTVLFGTRPWPWLAAVGLLTVAWVNLAPGARLAPLFLLLCAGAAVILGRRERSPIFALVALLSGLLLIASPWGTAVFGAPVAIRSLLAPAYAMLCGCIAGILTVADDREPEFPRAAAVLTVVVSVAAMLLMQPIMSWHASVVEAVDDRRRDRAPLRGIVPDTLPVDAVQTIDSWGSTPRIFAPRELGSYIVFELDVARPTPLVWDDASTPSDSAMRALEDELRTNPRAMWRGVFQQYDVDTALLPPSWNALADELAADPLWREIEGGKVRLFSRAPRLGAPPAEDGAAPDQNPPPNRK